MRSAQTALAVLALGLTTACSGGGSTGGSTNGTNGGSTSSSGGAYTVLEFDKTAAGQTLFNIAVGPSDQIGVVYYRNDPDGGMFAGDLDVDVMYTEVQSGAVTVPASIVQVLQLAAWGCTVAFQPNGLAAIGYFGGSDYNGETNSVLDSEYASENAMYDSGVVTGSTYWVQSQAQLDYRLSDGGWLQDVCMLSSTGGSCTDFPSASCAELQTGSDNGFDWNIDFPAGTADTSATQLCNNPFGEIVGLWPSLLFDGGTAVMAFRDIHEGQFPIQDWGASDTKMCIGGPGANFAFSAPLTISAAGDNQHNGFGVHNQIIYANGLLAEVADIDAKDQGTEASGSGPITFTVQTGTYTGSNADWTPPIDPFNPSGTGTTAIQNPGSGPSMVYSPTVGIGVAAVDLAPPGETGTPGLYFTNCTLTPISNCANPLMNPWGPRQPIFQLGSGGFFPDLQIDPASGNPIVSYTICSGEEGATPPGCDPSAAELDISEQTDQGWDSSTVLKGNYWHPRFRYLSTGKKVFVYSDITKGGLWIAIEN